MYLGAGRISIGGSAGRQWRDCCCVAVQARDVQGPEDDVFVKLTERVVCFIRRAESHTDEQDNACAGKYPLMSADKDGAVASAGSSGGEWYEGTDRRR